MKPPRPIEVEVLPPASARPLAGSRNLFDLIANLMDGAFRVPGTNFRFGLDPLLGLIPGAGDTITGLISILLLTQGFKSGLPKIIVARMALNILLNTALGALPVVGDAFSFWFKSNLRNQDLLRRYAGTGKKSSRSDQLFVIAIIAALLLILALVVAGILGLTAAALRSLGSPTS